MTAKQDQIIREMHVQPEINVQEEIRRSVEFLKDYLRTYSFLKTMVLGISGGQDSTLAGKLCQMAASELRKETGDPSYRFIAIRLPYGKQGDEQDAQDAVDWINPDEALCIDIRPTVDAATASTQQAGVTLNDFNEGNVKARTRMMIQYAVAGERSGVVIGTDHPAESATGFFTKYGDGASDLLPLFRLNKRQGRALLHELGAPEHLIRKVPIADLEDDKPAQPDEEALGVSYQDIDDYLEGRNVPDSAAVVIESWYEKTRHKRHLPITVFDDFWKTSNGSPESVRK